MVDLKSGKGKKIMSNKTISEWGMLFITNGKLESIAKTVGGILKNIDRCREDTSVTVVYNKDRGMIEISFDGYDDDPIELYYAYQDWVDTIEIED